MKRFTLAIILVASMMTFGQSTGGDGAASSGGLAFNSGDNAIGVGINFNYGYIGGSVAWDYSMKASPMFSLGAEFSATFSSYYSSYTYYNLSPQFRFGFHPFAIPSLAGKVAAANVLDPYAVLHIGPTIYGSSYEYTFGGITYNSNGVGFYDWGIALGVRWMMKPSFGLWGEVDWNRFIVGVAFKF